MNANINPPTEKVDKLNEITVGIIGIAGGYGQWLARIFSALGYSVIGSDPRHEQNIGNRKIVETANVVLFSVPMDMAPDVIREVVPYARKNQLWLDVTSLKKQPVAAMLESKAEVVGLHPMVAPTVDSWKGQVVKCN
ncbi:MAG: hypothetical protein ETSY2_51930 [Candidatus Entotheonella gemina]|uniref:Prephenate/arogenate dehydrogenase domain-containing protein n=1 Tax=Candidatus Entotheonella gemina TaxID=1429439 RepID=W4L4X5_9BACT|nr:MAG: hypothetical protein ETSY2_51930 [Candidatus Entotheonella gemina]